MQEIFFYDTLREGLWISVMMSAPVLVIALITGLTIGLFQALTSVQEMTLTFVPKVGAMMIVFWATMGFMTDMLVSFFQITVVPLIAGS